MNKTLIKGFILGIIFVLGLILVAGFLLKQSIGTSHTYNDGVSSKDWEKWEKLSTSQKIEKTNALVLLRYKKENETMAAYVDNVILRNSSFSPPLQIGDRVKKSDFYVTEHSSPSQRDGVLLLYIGNPLKKVEGTFLYSNDLIAYNNMPIDLFVSKFKKSINQ